MLLECLTCKATWPLGTQSCGDCGRAPLAPYRKPETPLTAPVSNPLADRIAALELDRRVEEARARAIPLLANTRGIDLVAEYNEAQLRAQERVVEGLDELAEKIDDLEQLDPVSPIPAPSPPERNTIAHGVSLAIVIVSFFGGLALYSRTMNEAPARARVEVLAPAVAPVIS